MNICVSLFPSSQQHKDVTVYLMHRDDQDFFAFETVSRSQTPVEIIVEALSSSKIAGHVWAFGVSNWATDRVESPTSTGFFRFNSPYFSLFEMNATRSIHAGGVQVTHSEMQDGAFQPQSFLNSYSPLGGWAIFDQPDLWRQAKQNALNNTNDPYWMNVYEAIFTDDNAARFDRLRNFTVAFNQKHFPANYTLDQMANAYVLAHKRADFLTIGPITTDELQRSVASLDLARQLTDSVLDYLHGGTAQ